jgi:hypothetical protein
MRGAACQTRGVGCIYGVAIFLHMLDDDDDAGGGRRVLFLALGDWQCILHLHFRLSYLMCSSCWLSRRDGCDATFPFSGVYVCVLRGLYLRAVLGDIIRVV